ncbi:MAG: valine--tRNA ligase [Kofleriaceae bacterium]
MFRTIDPATLPAHFEAATAEAKWGAVWEASGLHRWDPARPRDQTFVVDTPPPTVSGSLHVGHVFSYTHADVIVRQRRMRGLNIFYPMGWDDNGLPTERRVQNYFHVRCDPNVPYEPGLELAAYVAPSGPKQPRTTVSRRTFIELCERVTAEDERAFEALFRHIGLSVDWSQTYATINRHCRETAQLSFLDLHAHGHVYTHEAPTQWDVDFQTAIAAADLKDELRPGAFHDIKFAVEGSDETFVIATTRPELLPACVGVTAHPDDTRYAPLFGKRAISPLFGAPVPIFSSPLADREKGTGILMVCTFGDQTDVQWWRTQGLALRQIIGRDGTLAAVDFGSAAFPSTQPAAANAAYAQLAGKSVAQAQRAIVPMLREAGALVGEPKPIQHSVKMYEKGDRPLEFITTRQWFVKLLPQQAALLAMGERVTWHPELMHQRFRDWTEHLGLDWCVSRQRYFGVPIPAWYRIDARGELDYAAPILPRADQLPIDPMTEAPDGFGEAQRNQPGGFAGDPDVFDTWFTSSLTPQINSHWLRDPERHARLFPADLRPQSHEIIRTWAFYTIAKALLHAGSVPWHHVAISGWVVDPEKKKMGKTAGNATGPAEFIAEHGADGVRYWAASARLGTDTKLDVSVMKVGKRLATKLFNAGKLVLAFPAAPGGITHELDRAFVAELSALIAEATARYEVFDFAGALERTETFFWTRYTDTYLELAKARARGNLGDAAAQTSAVATMRLGLSVLLRLFAPVLPYITEEIWSWAFADETGQATIHGASWPLPLADAAAPSDPAALQLAIDALAPIHKHKSEREASSGRVVERLELRASADTIARIAPVLADVLAAAHVQAHSWNVQEITGFEVVAMDLAPKKPRVET